MINKSLTLAIITTVTLASCKENTKESTKEVTTIDSTISLKKPLENIITSTFVDADGKKMVMVFDDLNESATITIEGEVVELKRERVASGIWYKNDRYELRGKGEHAELTKDGKTIFKN